jgi:hypothetical protein
MLMNKRYSSGERSQLDQQNCAKVSFASKVTARS